MTSRGLSGFDWCKARERFRSGAVRRGTIRRDNRWEGKVIGMRFLETLGKIVFTVLVGVLLVNGVGLSMFFSSSAGETFVRVFNYMTTDFLANVVIVVFDALVVAVFAIVQYAVYRIVMWVDKRIDGFVQVRRTLGMLALAAVPILQIIMGWGLWVVVGAAVLGFVVAEAMFLSALDENRAVGMRHGGSAVAAGTGKSKNSSLTGVRRRKTMARNGGTVASTTRDTPDVF